jgi:Flp pilus assembly pilin Flp
MKRVLVAIGRLARKTDGQDLLEYGLLAALIAVVAMAAVSNLGQAIYTLFWRDIGNAI